MARDEPPPVRGPSLDRAPSPRWASTDRARRAPPPWPWAPRARLPYTPGRRATPRAAVPTASPHLPKHLEQIPRDPVRRAPDHLAVDRKEVDRHGSAVEVPELAPLRVR